MLNLIGTPRVVGTAGTSLAFTAPTGYKAGMIQFCAIGTFGNGTISPPSNKGWHPLDVQLSDGTAQGFRVYYRVCDGLTDLTSYTFSVSAAGNGSVGIMWMEDNIFLSPVQYGNSGGNVHNSNTTSLTDPGVTTDELEEGILFVGIQNLDSAAFDFSSTAGGSWSQVAVGSQTGAGSIVVGVCTPTTQAPTGSLVVSSTKNAHSITESFLFRTAVPTIVTGPQQIKKIGISYGGVKDQPGGTGQWQDQYAQLIKDQCGPLGGVLRTDFITVQNSDGTFVTPQWANYDVVANYCAKYGIEWIPNIHYAHANTTASAKPIKNSSGVLAGYKSLITQFLNRYGPGGTYVPPAGTNWIPVTSIELGNEPNSIGSCPQSAPGTRGQNTANMDYFGSSYPEYPFLMQRDGSAAINAWCQSKGVDRKTMTIIGIVSGGLEFDYIEDLIHYSTASGNITVCAGTAYSKTVAGRNTKFFTDVNKANGLVDEISIHDYMQDDPWQRGNNYYHGGGDARTDFVRDARSVGAIRELMTKYGAGSWNTIGISEGGYSASDFINFYQTSYGGTNGTSKQTDGSMGWNGPNSLDHSGNQIGEFPGVYNQMMGNMTAFDIWNRGNAGLDPEYPGIEFGVRWVSFYSPFDSGSINNEGYTAWQDGRAPTYGPGDTTPTGAAYGPLDGAGGTITQRSANWKPWGFGQLKKADGATGTGSNNPPTVVFSDPVSGAQFTNPSQDFAVSIIDPEGDDIATAKIRVHDGQWLALTYDSTDQLYHKTLILDSTPGVEVDNQIDVTAIDSNGNATHQSITVGVTVPQGTGSGTGGDPIVAIPSPSPVVTLKVVHYDHDGNTLGETTEMASLQWNQALSAVGNISYDLNLHDPLARIELTNPYVTDWSLLLNDDEIMAGLHTGTHVELLSRLVSVTGMDWLHYLEKRLLPYDPNNPVNKIYTADDDIFDQMRSLVDYVIDDSDLNLLFGRNQLGFGYPQAFLASDLQSLFQIIQQQSQNTPGFDFEITHDKYLEFYPMKGDYSTYRFIKGDNVINFIEDNSGPVASVMYGTGNGSGTSRLIKRAISSTGVKLYRTLDAQVDFSPISSLTQLQTLTNSILNTDISSPPDFQCQIIIQSGDTFFSEVSVGDMCYCHGDMEYKMIDGYYRVINIAGALQPGNTILVTVTFQANIQGQ